MTKKWIFGIEIAVDICMWIMNKHLNVAVIVLVSLLLQSSPLADENVTDNLTPEKSPRNRDGASTDEEVANEFSNKPSYEMIQLSAGPISSSDVKTTEDSVVVKSADIVVNDVTKEDNKLNDDIINTKSSETTNEKEIADIGELLKEKTTDTAIVEEAVVMATSQIYVDAMHVKEEIKKQREDGNTEEQSNISQASGTQTTPNEDKNDKRRDHDADVLKKPADVSNMDSTGDHELIKQTNNGTEVVENKQKEVASDKEIGGAKSAEQKDQTNEEKASTENTEPEPKIEEQSSPPPSDVNKSSDSVIIPPTMPPTVPPSEGDIKSATPPSEEKTVKLEVDDIQSFEEWKKKQIQDREAAANETNVIPQRTIRTKKTQVNYASQDCGAKVLSHNPKAKHVSAVLDENRDLYMLNPCSDHIWFVVELCEPIQIRQIQLANLELFSSSPRLFDLYISERYPAREWRPLGTFEARNERAIQTFEPNREEMMFAKYIKFEMKSHFGNEHFCPLTLIRVLGVSMVEEYEEVDDQKIIKDPNKKEESKESNTQIVEDSKQVEDVGKETGEKDEKAKDEGSIGKMFNIVKNAVDNLLGNGGNVETNNTKSVNATDGPITEQNVTQDEPIDPTWESPVTLVTNKSEVEQSPVSSTKVPIITLIETGDGREVVHGVTNNTPLYPLKFLSNISTKNFGTKICWFLEFMYRVSILSCIVQPPGNYTSALGAFPHVIYKNVTEVQKTPTISPDVTKIKEDALKSDKEDASVAEAENKTLTANIDGETLPKDVDMKIDQKKIETEPKLNSTKTKNKVFEVHSHMKMGRTENPNFGKEIKAVLKGRGNTAQKCDSGIKEITKPTRDNATVEITKVVADKIDKNLEVATEQKNQSNEVKDEVKNEDEIKSNKSTGDGDAKENKETEKQVDEQKQEKETSEMKANVTHETTEPPSVDPTTAIPPLHDDDANKLEKQVVVEDQVVINPGTNQKESVLMRLSNRIRALEQNMSLSSAYLEDLSQRYKRQMDEMQRAFNHTQTRLSETSRTTEENDLKQTEAIASVQNKAQVLTVKLSEIAGSVEQLNHYMIARHLCLMAIESIILIVICVTCFGVRQIRLVRRLEQMEKQIQQLVSSHKSSLTNGHVKMTEPVNIKTNKRSKPAIKTVETGKEVLVESRPRQRLKSLDIGVKNTKETQSVSRSNPSTPTLQRRKLVKTPSSPLHKRKFNHYGKVRKPTKNYNGGIPSSTQLQGTLVSDFVKNPKPKKNTKTERKHESLAGLDSAYGVYRNSNLVPNCGTNTVPWNSPNNMFSTLSGKAR